MPGRHVLGPRSAPSPTGKHPDQVQHAAAGLVRHAVEHHGLASIHSLNQRAGNLVRDQHGRQHIERQHPDEPDVFAVNVWIETESLTG